MLGSARILVVKKIAHDLPPRFFAHRGPTANGFPNIFSIGVEFFR